jgi:hypothetical protein
MSWTLHKDSSSIARTDSRQIHVSLPTVCCTCYIFVISLRCLLFVSQQIPNNTCGLS